MIKNLMFFLAIFFFCLTLPLADAANRTALVIGNGAYVFSPLRNPVNDAADMAAALKDNGFNVLFETNATRKAMELSIREFGKSLRQGGVGLFYYAGHGIQVKGKNYLIPIGSVIESEGDVQFEAVDVGLVLSRMEDAGNRLNIVILDACRNNPFARRFRSSFRGLARMDAPKGSLIAYATAPGSIAADGRGRNGVYTRHLIKNIHKSGIPVEQVFKNIRVAVVSETRNSQVPWEASSLMGTFYFNPKKIDDKSIQKQIIVKKKQGGDAYELLFWDSIKDSQDAKMFEAYLLQYPGGVFSKLAELKIKQYYSGPELNQPTATLPEELPEQPDEVIPQEPVQTAVIIPEETQLDVMARDGRYTKYQNGIVYDETTGLEWFAGPDKHMGGNKARAWVRGLTIAGGNWRMPSDSELKGIYKIGAGTRNMTPLLETSGWGVWSSPGTGFSFDRGTTDPHDGDGLVYFDRAFAVRLRP